MDVSLSMLRAVRQVAESGSFTAAAAVLGSTQSAVSRQVGAAERAAGHRLFDRSQSGAILTSAGRVFLQQATVALTAMDEAERRLGGSAPTTILRIGHFALAGPALLPRLLADLAERRPDLTVSTREATSPALVRGLRTGTLDAALVTTRPPHRAPDDQLPALRMMAVGELTLGVAVAAAGPLGDRDELTADDLRHLPWITSPGSTSEPALGAWPGLPGRPAVRHVARDWLTKLSLVGAGQAVTTMPLGLPSLPAAVRVLPVVDLPAEVRRVSLLSSAELASDVIEALAEAVEGSLSD